MEGDWLVERRRGVQQPKRRGERYNNNRARKMFLYRMESRKRGDPVKIIGVGRRLGERRRGVQQPQQRGEGYNNNLWKTVLYCLVINSMFRVTPIEEGSGLGIQTVVGPCGACGNWCRREASPFSLPVEERRGGRESSLLWNSVLCRAFAQSR